MWIIIVVLSVALVAGLVANHWVRPFAKSEVQGVKLELLVSPLLTLSVLLLAFLLVQVYASYKTVRDASSEEAGKVLAEFDISGYLPPEYAAPLQSSVVCYSRSVAEIEWGKLDEGAAVDRTVSHWGNKIDEPMAQLAAERSDQPYGTLLSVDRERAEARRKRITEARPSVPVELTLLLLGISALGVFSLAAFTLPYVSRRVQVGALLVLVTALGGMQLMLVEIDGKYDGVVAVEPTDLRAANELMTAKFEAKTPGDELPCDDQGRLG